VPDLPNIRPYGKSNNENQDWINFCEFLPVGDSFDALDIQDILQNIS